MPSILSQGPAGFGTRLADLGGAPSIEPGRMEWDVLKGIAAEDYIASRFLWIGIAIAIAAVAGLLYRPHRAKAHIQRLKWLGKLSLAKLLPTAKPQNSPAPHAAVPLLGLLLTETRLIASGPLLTMLAVAASLAGLAPDGRRHAGWLH